MLGQNGGSRTDTLIKLVLIFFISLLSFSVGTFVGKQFSDSQHKLSQLENEYDSSGGSGSRETASIPAHALDVKPDEALTDKDIQQIADEFTKPEAVGEHHEGEPSPIPSNGEKGNTEAAKDEAPRDVASAPSKVEDPKAEAVKETANRVANGKTPTEARKEVKSALPKELPDSVATGSIGKYTVQLSSHQSEDEAKDEAGKLKAKGFSAFVVPANIKGKQWYRVSVGLFDSKNEAETYKGRLLKEAGVASAFIQKIVQ
jgi:cell division septation protein DedD